MIPWLAGLCLMSPNALAQAPPPAEVAPPSTAEVVPAEPEDPAVRLADEADRLAAERLEVEAQREALEAEREALRQRERALEGQAEAESHTGFGRRVHVPAGEEWHEAVAFGGDIRVEGHVTGDAVSFGGDVVILDGGRVDQGAVSFGGKVVVMPGGTLEGDRVAMAMPSMAGDMLLPLDPSGASGFVDPPRGLWKDVQWRLVLLLAIAGAGVLTVGVFPDRVRRIARDLEVRPLRAALLGSLASGFVVVFSVLLAVLTLGLGLPISLILLCGLGVAWLLGFVGLCQAVGDRLPLDQRPYGRWLAFLVGVVPLAFLGSLPWIGWVVVGAASIIGVGGAVSTRLGSITVDQI